MAATVQTPKRGRPRASNRTPRILKATLDLLHEIGYDRMRIQDVATRAGVGLATIYRRWPTKRELILDALSSDEITAPLAVHGDPLTNLESSLRMIARRFPGADDQFIPGLLVALRDDPDVRNAFRDVAVGRVHTHLLRLLRGILGDREDLDLRAHIVPALILYHMVILGDPLEPEVAAAQLLPLLTTATPATASPRKRGGRTRAS